MRFDNKKKNKPSSILSDSVSALLSALNAENKTVFNLH